jgi:mRNA export factor
MLSGHTQFGPLASTAGGCDKQVSMWSLATNQKQVVGKHDAPVVFAHHVKEMSNMLITGSWDKTVRYWDLRQPNPVHTQQMPERVYALDVQYPLMVAGMAGRKIQVGCYRSVQG